MNSTTTIKCSVFIATSVDGYIATRDDGVEWLENAGRSDVDMGEHTDMGFGDYLASVDCMIMGRKCMEKIASFNLSPQQWPYGDLPIYVLSATLKEAPANMPDTVQIHSGDIPDLLSLLEAKGLKHAYVDGGTTITGFLNLKLIDEMTITQAPVLLGDGLPLFGKMDTPIVLTNTQTKAYPNDFIQSKYHVSYR